MNEKLKFCSNCWNNLENIKWEFCPSCGKNSSLKEKISIKKELFWTFIKPILYFFIIWIIIVLIPIILKILFDNNI